MKLIDDLQLQRVSSEIEIATIWLTPEVAANLLRSMPSNRPLRRGRVSLMADDIRNGRYTFNPNPIVVDDQGNLIDGQHRCHAVIEAEQAIPAIIMAGFPHETMDVIDTGRSRSVGDILQLEDVHIVQRNLAAGAAKAVIQYERLPDIVWSGPGSYVSQQEVLLALKSDPAMWSTLATRGYAIASALPSRRAGGWVTGAAMAASLYLIERYSANLDLLPNFEQGLLTGEMLREGDPRLTLRSATNHKSWGGQQSSLMALINTWNKYVEDEPMKIVRARQSMLPIPKPR